MKEKRLSGRKTSDVFVTEDNWQNWPRNYKENIWLGCVLTKAILTCNVKQDYLTKCKTKC